MVQPVAIDPALLTDGLKAEREQGITIDVAYRYFSTQRENSLLPILPGTNNTSEYGDRSLDSDLAIILIDARHGVLTQTKRHSFIVSLLGIKHVLVAINKMDLVEFGQNVLRKYVMNTSNLHHAWISPICTLSLFLL